MKGPRSRHRHNVHRIWECSACQKRVFELPRVTHRQCCCLGKDKPTWMRLIELPPPWRKAKPSDPPAEPTPVPPEAPSV